MNGPRLIHCITQKGKGFPLVRQSRSARTSAGHDPATGKQRKVSSANSAYTAAFGQGLVELASENPRVVAITARCRVERNAAFAKAYPQRFFDVGIAEGHAVTFAAGLATEGIRPVCAIYSTFLQRAYTTSFTMSPIQHLPVVFAMDRAGLVGEDGPTHMGLYDIAYMLAVPGMVVTAPKNGREMIALLRSGTRVRQGTLLSQVPARRYAGHRSAGVGDRSGFARDVGNRSTRHHRWTRP